MNKEEQKIIQIKAILIAALFIILSIGLYLIFRALNRLYFYQYFLFPVLLLIFCVVIPISIYISNKARNKKK